MGDIGYILTHFERNWDFNTIRTPHFLKRQFIAAFAAIIALEAIQLLNGRLRLVERITWAPLAPRWALYMAFLFVVVMFGVYKSTYFYLLSVLTTNPMAKR